MVQRFSRAGRLLKKINKKNMCLMPKCKLPQTAGDYRPTALCNSTYKLISKILANRLKIQLEKIISPMQDTYVHGRQIGDNITLAQELIHCMKKKKSKKNYMALKLDMPKAFDRVEWSFLVKVMQQLGFNNK